MRNRTGRKERLPPWAGIQAWGWEAGTSLLWEEEEGRQLAHCFCFASRLPFHLLLLNLYSCLPTYT